MAVYLTNVMSGTQPVPSKAELIDNRKFEWSYEGVGSTTHNSVAIDLPVASAGEKPREAAGKPGEAAGPANPINLTASATSGPVATAPSQTTTPSPPDYARATKEVIRRKFYGIGTFGTERKFTLPLFRFLSVTQVRSIVMCNHQGFGS